MNKIDLLKSRRAQLLEIGSEIRKAISQLVDEKSFVELDAYSFSQNDFYGENAQGEGVVTGYATIDETPVYVVAQNVKVLSGGVSYANCQKIKKCLNKALDSGYPVIYLFDSLGVQVGEGVNVLEGIADVLNVANSLKGEVPQFSIVYGKLYGAFSILAANADYNFMITDSKVAYASPFVLAATSGKKVGEDDVAGAKATALNDLTNFKVESIEDVKAKILSILSVLPNFSDTVSENQDELNVCAPNLNEKTCPKCLVSAVFDKGTFVELDGGFCPEVITGIGRVGGISSAAILFGGEDKGVELNLSNVLKLKYFANYAAENSLPLVIFVNTLGIKVDMQTSNTLVLKEICNLIGALKYNSRISVVYGKAIGLGYSLFAAKSAGVDYSFAFANAKIALFDGASSSVAFGQVAEDKMAEFEEKYSNENADPINAAKNGYIDNIIEPQYVRSYVISALQMLVR